MTIEALPNVPYGWSGQAPPAANWHLAEDSKTDATVADLVADFAQVEDHCDDREHRPW
jgi:hypothetical protein